jgi:hypothetical protein
LCGGGLSGSMVILVGAVVAARPQKATAGAEPTGENRGERRPSLAWDGRLMGP